MTVHHTKGNGDLGVAKAHADLVAAGLSVLLPVSEHVCICCPDTDRCYYLRPDAFRQSVSLRVAPSRNNQRANVLDAEDYRRFPC